MKYYLYGVVLGLGLLGMACSEESIDTKTGSLIIQLNNVVGGAELTLNKTIYTNATGESFTVNKFDYFVSNIRLLKADGTEFVVPQENSYFLVREIDAASQTIQLNDVPQAQYKGLSFVVGVDSLRSVSGTDKRKGVLDPKDTRTAGMIWDLNTGYIFLKLEGTSPAAPVDVAGQRTFRYHIGLFGRNGTLNNLRTIPVAFGTQEATPATTGTSTIYIDTDVNKIFDGRSRLSLAQTPDVMMSPKSADVANNYATMFSFAGVKNTER